MKSRIISAVIAIIYIAGAYFTADAATMWQIGVFLILPLSCIWFSDSMGGYTGVGMVRGAVTSGTPGCLVAFGGWLLLLLPMIVAGFMALSENK